MRILLLLLLAAALLSTGCREEAPAPDSAPQPPAGSETATAEPAAETDPRPPSPPLHEDFEGQPQLSLFPRVGDFQPAAGDERLPFWATFIDHVSRVAGLVKNTETGNRAWSFRSIDTVDSLAFFSPVAVEPDTTYRVGFRLKADLPDGAATGVGILEFDEFLWVGEQYSEDLFTEHYRGTHPGLRLAGAIDWEEHAFTFTTGHDTRMIHLVLFREGPHSRNAVLFDDLTIQPFNETGPS